MREVEGRKLVELILKGQGGQGLRQTSAAILNIGTDVTDGLKWRLCKVAQLSQITLVLVCDGIVTAWNELVQRCLCSSRRDAAERPQHAGGVPVYRNRVWTRRAQGYQPRSWESVLQVANCQQLTCQRQLPGLWSVCVLNPSPLSPKKMSV